MSGEILGRKMNATIKDAQHYNRTVLSVQTLFARKDLTDLCFVCAQGRKVYAHRLLLCSVSTFLKEMCSEIQVYVQTILIHLPDVDFRIIELLLDFLYEGSVRVNQHEYKDFQEVMIMLGVVLTPPTENPRTISSEPSEPVQPVIRPPQQLQAQAPQLVYVPTVPNAQGQMQYVLASPAPVLQSPVRAQPQPPQQIVQQVQQPIQQGNMMQVIQQNNGSVVAGQMVHCAGQVDVQGTQQNMIPVGIQPQVAQSSYMADQPVQQQPQYVMASSNQLVMSSPNQMSTSQSVQMSSRPTAQFPQRQRGIARARPSHTSTQQLSSINAETAAVQMSVLEDIMSIVQENSADLENLSTRKIRVSLEKKLGIDLADREEDIDMVLKRFVCEDDSSVVNSVDQTHASLSVPQPEPKTRKRKKKPKKTKSPHYSSKSDDEADVDFVPNKPVKKSRGRPKKKLSYTS